MRRQWGKAIAMISALGLISAPGVSAGGGINKDQNVAISETPKPVVIEREQASFNYWNRVHPVWLGVAKRGKGRKNGGGRSRWNYRR